MVARDTKVGDFELRFNSADKFLAIRLADDAKPRCNCTPLRSGVGFRARGGPLLHGYCINRDSYYIDGFLAAWLKFYLSINYLDQVLWM